MAFNNQLLKTAM